jgi:hypothetical protein
MKSGAGHRIKKHKKGVSALALILYVSEALEREGNGNGVKQGLRRAYLIVIPVMCVVTAFPEKQKVAGRI